MGTIHIPGLFSIRHQIRPFLKEAELDIIKTDVAIVGAGGAGLRAAIAIAEQNPSLDIALISKVYPMRSHTVAAEGGAAGVARDDDSLENHFNDTVSGGDWLCEQDVVEYFVENCTKELIQLEHWGCPWSRKPDGKVNVRPFGCDSIRGFIFAMLFGIFIFLAGSIF